MLHRSSPIFSRLNLRVYGAHHLHALLHGFRQLSRAPLATLMTLAVLSIALMLPAGLLLILGNVQHATKNLNVNNNMSIYLRTGVTSQQAQQILKRVNHQIGVLHARYISPQQGLEEFQQVSDLGKVLEGLASNPLPGVIVVEPSEHNPVLLAQLRAQLALLPNIASVQIDLQWVKRLFALLALGTTFVSGLFILLALTVVLIIANTVRLALQKYHQEIRVMKLVGASSAFMRRPFLYSGVLYGFAAGIMAILLLSLCIAWLQPAVQHVALLYQSQFSLHGMDSSSMFNLLMFSIALGWLGSWFVVTRQIKQ
ncbi:MAG: ABC transporter permease [Gammaproteobacteria bacterium]|nr:ABC transporter permease [Gammaproteobacteria bacterium]